MAEPSRAFREVGILPVSATDSRARVSNGNLCSTTKSTDPSAPQYPNPRSAPSTTQWRNNLTALSQYHNLYFVAYGYEIHVYLPSFPEQTLKETGLKWKLPQSSANRHRDPAEYTSFGDSHVANQIIVGDLGHTEILVCACDDGDVIVYTSQHILEALKESKDQRNRPEGVDISIRPFMIKNVGKAAWGVALHRNARLLAISANSYEITIFAPALTQNDIIGVGLENDYTSRPECRSSSETSRVGKTNLSDRRWDKEIVLKGHSHNIPNIAFCNTTDDRAGRYLVSTDIHGSTIIWDIYQGKGLRKIRIGPQQDSRMFFGWGLACISREIFRPARSTAELLGCQKAFCPGGGFNVTAGRNQVRDSAKIHHSLQWAFTSPSQSPATNQHTMQGTAVNQSSFGGEEEEEEELEEEQGDESGSDENNDEDVPGILTSEVNDGLLLQDDGLPALPTDIDEDWDENYDVEDDSALLDDIDFGLNSSIPPYSAGSQIPTSGTITSAISSSVNMWSEDVQSIAFSNYNSINSNAVNVPSNGDHPSGNRVSLRDRGILGSSTASTDLRRAAEGVPFVLFHTGHDIVMLIEPPFDHASAVCFQPCEQRIPASLANVAPHERLNMIRQIEDLGIVIAASQMGRVAIFSLTQVVHEHDGLGLDPSQMIGTSKSKSKNRGRAAKDKRGPKLPGNPRHTVTKAASTPVWPRRRLRYAMRLDWVIPFASQERSNERPLAALYGIAASPIQGCETGSEAVGTSNPEWRQSHHPPRRWRLILTYYDLSILSYELWREEDTIQPSMRQV